ncbi:hypothetical protein PybrP1_004882 [[Pythium] brassicae (nom. inval.)]|nr:hypothetical protein PybrP1_004882 [[Pythium] brassicae (nom. inval.)]
MLRKLFSGGAATANAVKSDGGDSARCEKMQVASTTDFSQLVSRLEDFEGQLKAAINTLSRHCQAITEVSFSTKNLELALGGMFGVADPQLLQGEEAGGSGTSRGDNSSSWIPLVAEFRTSTIAPLQEVLAEIPQLKVLCEHRNSALTVKARYEKKIEEIHEIDEKIRSDIMRLLARGLSDLLGDSLEKPAEPAISNIHILPKHILHEDRSVLPAKKHVYGTRTWNLHRRIKNSMANGLDLTECIQLPDGYQLEEWVAVHVIDFFNEISLLFGTVSEFCTAETCPQMTAGPCYTYLWADGAQQVTPIGLPAPEYVDRLLHWVQEQLDNAQVFPLDGIYSNAPVFLRAAGVIFKRLFRVYAHLYHNHLEHYVALHAETHLNFCFKRFVFFVKEFQLVDQKELNALRKLIQTIAG